MKEVLIFVAGTTSQIITETIYALIHQKPPVYPDEIHVITTTHGKRLIKENRFISELVAISKSIFND
jgi:CRISPR-associated protein (TIGR02584 family)